MDGEVRVPLKYRCAAVIVTEDSDRPMYIPPPIPKYDHHVDCGCPLCVPRKRP
jgi:hypothetical protein